MSVSIEGPCERPNEKPEGQNVMRLGPNKFRINEDYRARGTVPHYDATQNADGPWQRPVYRKACDLFRLHGLRSILDIGCGSGQKLMEFFSGSITCGVEVEPTLSYLRATYPDRLWRAPQCVMLPYDMVICADVIEHVQDPDGLLENIKSARPKIVVISTPERTLIPGADPLGPPRNPHHIMEWTKDEFRAYMEGHFEVLEHLTDPEQYAQTIVCRSRRD